MPGKTKTAPEKALASLSRTDAVRAAALLACHELNELPNVRYELRIVGTDNGGEPLAILIKRQFTGDVPFEEKFHQLLTERRTFNLRGFELSRMPSWPVDQAKPEAGVIVEYELAEVEA